MTDAGSFNRGEARSQSARAHGGDGLCVNAVSKSFGDLVALDNVSLSVRPGELYGFVGSNGAGKTTTMRIILGVLSADSGTVLLNGKPVDLNQRRRMGYMPADRGLYPKMKVGEHLIYLARLHGMSREEAKSSVEQWTIRLGVDSRMNDTVDTLSTGNQQRVQLAAALVHQPNVLVLDEPFSGLDPVAVDVMSQVLLDMRAEGVPVLFSSHQLELVEQLCDRVGVIVDGRLSAEGTVDELRGEHPVQVDVMTSAAPRGWAEQLGSVTTVLEGDGLTRLELGDGVDDQEILSLALSFGPVAGFARRRPPLSELYREVVGS